MCVQMKSSKDVFTRVYVKFLMQCEVRLNNEWA